MVNEIGAALAKQLDYDAIIELVGDRLAAMFSSKDMFIALVDEKQGLITFPYELDAGRRLHGRPIQRGEGLTSVLLDSRTPLRYGSIADQLTHGAVIGTYVEDTGTSGSRGSACRSLPARRRSALWPSRDPRPNAFTERDERVVSTVAASMGVALENARLFAETKRLLSETNERAAELALINDVQRGLAANLDMQAMYDLVGDKIQEIFDAQVVDIGILDRTAGMIHFPYTIEEGVRSRDEAIPLLSFRRVVVETGQPLLVDDYDREKPPDAPATPRSGKPTRSVVMVPLTAGGEVTGVMSLQNVDRTSAFDEGDRDLLSTLAASLSVALENARLFAETKRLLSETNERAAELALINDVQRGLAANLDMQAMYDLVGDKIQEIFDAQVVDIAIFRAARDEFEFAYTIERGVRFPNESMPNIGPRRHVVEGREPLVFNEDLMQTVQAYGQAGVVSGEAPRSAVYAPMISGGEARGVISLQNLDREHAFSDADVRLLMTLASSLSVALENARLFDETKRLLAETDERAAELAIMNSVQEGLAQNLDMQAMYDLVGDQIQQIFDSQVVDIAIFDFEAGVIHYPYTNERGVRYPDEATLMSGAPVTQELIRTGAPVLISDMAAWDADHEAPIRRRAGRAGGLALLMRSAHRREGGSRAASPSRTWTAPTPSARLMSASSRPLRPACRWRSTTPACSTRRTVARRNWRSSTMSSAASLRSSTRRRCTSWWANGPTTCSTPTWWTSSSSTTSPGRCARSSAWSAGCASPRTFGPSWGSASTCWRRASPC